MADLTNYRVKDEQLVVPKREYLEYMIRIRRHFLQQVQIENLRKIQKCGKHRIVKKTISGNGRIPCTIMIVLLP